MSLPALDGPPPIHLPPAPEGPPGNGDAPPADLPDIDATRAIDELAPPPPPPWDEPHVEEGPRPPDPEPEPAPDFDADPAPAFDFDIDFAAASSPIDVDPPAGPPGEGGGEKAAEVARSKIGNMYSWGGKGPEEFDCSGLVSFALNESGLMDGYKTSQMLAKAGTSVAEEDMRAGDVVIYNGGSHVGICVAPGRVVHASRTGEPIAEGDIGVGGEVSDIRRIDE